jgi:Flp pilus assembly pilin Flp
LPSTLAVGGSEKQVAVRRIDRHEAGNSFIEYVFLAALIAVVCLTAVTLLGQEASATHSRNTDRIVNAG